MIRIEWCLHLKHFPSGLRGPMKEAFLSLPPTPPDRRRTLFRSRSQPQEGTRPPAHSGGTPRKLIYSGFRMGCTRSWSVLIHGQVLFTLVPTLRVGMPSATLRVVFAGLRPRAGAVGWPVAAPVLQREVRRSVVRRACRSVWPRKTTRSVGDGIPTRSVGTSVSYLHHWKPGGVCHSSVNRCIVYRNGGTSQGLSLDAANPDRGVEHASPPNRRLASPSRRAAQRRPVPGATPLTPVRMRRKSLADDNDYNIFNNFSFTA